MRGIQKVQGGGSGGTGATQLNNSNGVQNQATGLKPPPFSTSEVQTENRQLARYEAGHQQMQFRLQEQGKALVQPKPEPKPEPERNGPLATLIPDMVHVLGSHLEPHGLFNLSGQNQHFRGLLLKRRQTVIANAMLLARGEATIQPDGAVVRQDPPIMNPARFDDALRYLQPLPVGLQREPLQELVRRATTPAQLEAVFDHRRNQGGLTNIPLPPDLPTLSSAAQRAVECFSWRLSGGPRPGFTSLIFSRELRDELVNAYADLLSRVEGMTLPYPSNLDNEQIRHLMDIFGAPAGLDAVTGHDWLTQQSQQGNLRLTPQIYERFPEPLRALVRASVRNTMPAVSTDMARCTSLSDHFASGYWPLNPPTI